MRGSWSGWRGGEDNRYRLDVKRYLFNELPLHSHRRPIVNELVHSTCEVLNLSTGGNFVKQAANQISVPRLPRIVIHPGHTEYRSPDYRDQGDRRLLKEAVGQTLPGAEAETCARAAIPLRPPPSPWLRSMFFMLARHMIVRLELSDLRLDRGYLGIRQPPTFAYLLEGLHEIRSRVRSL